MTGQRHVTRTGLQFTLRGLLLFTLVVSVCLSPLSRWLYRKRRERAALAAVATVRGDFYYDFELMAFSTGGRVVVPGLQPPGPAWARKLCGDDFFAEVVSVGFAPRDAAKVTDTWLTNLVPLTSLDSLDLSYSNVTTAGLIHLRPFRKLVRLGLGGTRIRGPVLRQLGNLPSLKYLSLAQTLVDDESLRYLKNCSSLEELDLSNTTVCGSGLASLAGLPRLTELDLSDSNVTREGLTSLAALKHLRILWLQGAAIDDDCLSALSEVASLRMLAISTDKITGAGLPYLTRLPKLMQLCLMMPSGIDQGEDVSPSPRIPWYLRLSGADTPEGEKVLEGIFPRCEVVPLPQDLDPIVSMSSTARDEILRGR